MIIIRLFFSLIWSALVLVTPASFTISIFSSSVFIPALVFYVQPLSLLFRHTHTSRRHPHTYNKNQIYTYMSYDHSLCFFKPRICILGTV